MPQNDIVRKCYDMTDIEVQNAENPKKWPKN